MEVVESMRACRFVPEPEIRTTRFGREEDMVVVGWGGEEKEAVVVGLDFVEEELKDVVVVVVVN